jgi:sugar/nucleoside kinase (ribokinase family)
MSSSPHNTSTPRKLFAIMGTIGYDVVTHEAGEGHSGVGGILYQAAGLCALDLEVALFANVGEDYEAEARAVTEHWPGCHTDGLRTVPGPGNRVFLHYPARGERVEVLRSHVPPLDPQRVIDGLPGCRMLISVINSGFDIGLAAWRRIADAAACPVWFDIHSLALTQVVGGTRRYRPLPEWPDWVAGVTYLQANVQEVASMLGDPETLPGPEGILGFGRTAMDLGVRAVFLTMGKDGAMVLTHDGTRRVGCREQGRVVDTTGCGDIFCAGAAAMLALGSAPGAAAAFGVELASEAIGAAGVLNTYELIRNRLLRA